MERPPSKRRGYRKLAAAAGTVLDTGEKRRGTVRLPSAEAEQISAMLERLRGIVADLAIAHTPEGQVLLARADTLARQLRRRVEGSGA